MQCLINYISIEGCSAPAYTFDDNSDGDDNPETEPPTASGLFINVDLPISLEMIDKIADSEQATFLGVWEEVQNRGLKKFELRVKAAYVEMWGQCDIDENWYCTNKQELAMPLLYFLGAELMYERLYSTRINRYTTIDKNKASELRKDFLKEFDLQLRDALILIGADSPEQQGDVFSYVEVIP